jgi:ferredoxin, 2Fe-2S
LKMEITFYVTHRGTRHEVKTYPYEYTSLMALLYDTFYFENFGDCKGIGRCGTCHVMVENPPSELLTRVGNEQTTLSKMENTSESSRLSCQIPITEAIDQMHFVVMDDGDLGLY